MDHTARKEIPMPAIIVRTTVPLLLVLLCGAVSFAGEPSTPQASSAPSIESTYRLVSRQFRDGTTLKPPEVMGLFTYTKTHRNFNIVRKDATGKFSSRSSVSTYKLTATEYTETLLFSIVNDQIGGKDMVYDLSGQTRSAPITMDGGRLQFTLPFEPRALVFEGNTLTATATDSTNVDTWEKVE
jgi:hypothetical protein